VIDSMAAVGKGQRMGVLADRGGEIGHARHIRAIPRPTLS
jgi:flagellar biosynthesis/type III secretory pathway ATPase